MTDIANRFHPPFHFPFVFKWWFFKPNPRHQSNIKHVSVLATRSDKVEDVEYAPLCASTFVQSQTNVERALKVNTALSEPLLSRMHTKKKTKSTLPRGYNKQRNITKTQLLLLKYQHIYIVLYIHMCEGEWRRTGLLRNWLKKALCLRPQFARWFRFQTSMQVCWNTNNVRHHVLWECCNERVTHKTQLLVFVRDSRVLHGRNYVVGDCNQFTIAQHNGYLLMGKWVAICEGNETINAAHLFADWWDHRFEEDSLVSDWVSDPETSIALRQHSISGQQLFGSIFAYTKVWLKQVWRSSSNFTFFAVEYNRNTRR